MSKANRAGWVTLGLVAGAGTLLGVGAGEALHNDRQGEITAVDHRITQIEEGFLGADLEADELELRLGEGCFALLGDYGPDGPLAATEEDSIVDDLLRAPNAPCGESPTEVRGDVRAYLDATSAIPDGEARITELEADKEELRDEEADARGLDRFGGGVAGAVIGIVGGFIIGCAVEGKVEKSEKRKLVGSL